MSTWNSAYSAGRTRKTGRVDNGAIQVASPSRFESTPLYGAKKLGDFVKGAGSSGG